MKLLDVELQLMGETKSCHNDFAYSEAHSSLGLLGVDCTVLWTVLHPQRLLVTRGGLERYFWVTGQGRKPRPDLGSWPWPAPLWAPVHQNSQWKTWPCSRHSTVHRWEPQAAVGHRVGGIIMATLSFAFSLSSTSIRFMMKCLRYFLLEILKKTVSI